MSNPEYPLPKWPKNEKGIQQIPRDKFVVGQYVFAEWDEEPNLIHAKNETMYMIMRGPGKTVPQWLSFEDALSAEEAADKFPQYAYLYQ